MQELNMVEVSEVSGGGIVLPFLLAYAAGKALDFAINAVATGQVGYSDIADQSYCVTGA